MASSNISFNILTKKYTAFTFPATTLFAKFFDPNGSLILNKSTTANPFIGAVGSPATISDSYSLPVDTNSDILQGTYLYYYTETANDLNQTISVVSTLPTEDTVSVGVLYLVFQYMVNVTNYFYKSYTWDPLEEEFVQQGDVFGGIYNYLGSDITCLDFNVSNDCNFYPTGQITATDTTNYGIYNIDDRSIKLYYPNGLSPAPISPYVETTTAASLVVNTLATGLWTAILTTNLQYTQVDGLAIYFQLKKTLTNNVVCNSQLCTVNDALDQITSAYAADVACGSTTPRYAQELTLANAYYTQYQIERSCGNTLAAAAYADKLTALVGRSSSSCSGSCGCSDSNCSCDTSCGCSGHDSAPQWVNNTSSETGYKSYVALLSQTNTENPEAKILENSLGDIDWQWDGNGEYFGYSFNAFPAEKTFVRINLSSNISEIITAYRASSDYIYIKTGGSDNILRDNAFEIRVYN
jgi:hypothetical protein